MNRRSQCAAFGFVFAAVALLVLPTAVLAADPTGTGLAEPDRRPDIERAAVSPAPDGSAMVDVVAGGPGFVGVGISNFDPVTALFTAGVWTSPDGREWTGAPESPTFHGAAMAGVTELNGLLVAVGNASTIEATTAAVWTSHDGLSWNRIEGGPAFENGQMIDVVPGGPGLVAVGSDPGSDASVVWTSPDGVSWTRVPHQPALDHSFMWAVTTGGPGLVAGGWRRNPEPVAAIWTSADGITWTLAPDPPGGAGFQIRALLNVDGRLVAAGDLVAGGQAAVWTSGDGVNWRRSPDAPSFAGAAIVGLTRVGPGIVAVGGRGFDAAAWVSRDGRTWFPVGDDDFEGAYLTAVAAAGRTVVAVGAVQRESPAGVTQNAAAWFATIQAPGTR